MTLEERINFKIVGGPGKFDLMLGIFENKTITFKLQSGSEVSVKLRSVKQEDCSLNSWNIEGYICGHSEYFSGYYNTKGNDGWFKF